ncbi:polysaccharide biosynthesis protein [Candidatus Ruthia endofausta]|uniref:polysaccharide biosynthesis protein n=1 Tax=Candidatus Ruthia endofausta TaxID=2738852 RepID=UPI001FE3224F|nr:polysaccharide biosynthesis protein [Candidatus Ruthia endofausta]
MALVIQAGAMGSSDDVFVLDMGKPVRIYDLVLKMIHLTGLELKDSTNLNGDIEIEITDLRSGKKIFEELLIDDNALGTNHSMIMKAQDNMLSWDELKLVLASMELAITNYDQDKLRSLLIQLVPDFKPQCDISDLLFNG